MSEIIAAQDLVRWRQWAKTQAIATDISVEEVDWFLQGLTTVDRLSLWLGIREAVQSQVSLVELSRLWERRCQEKIPVQYLVGKTPWRNFELVVSPAVLIPRPETEYLIDLAQASHRDLHAGHWIDLGTGSGAIALVWPTVFPTERFMPLIRVPPPLRSPEKMRSPTDHKIEFSFTMAIGGNRCNTYGDR